MYIENQKKIPIHKCTLARAHNLTQCTHTTYMHTRTHTPTQYTYYTMCVYIYIFTHTHVCVNHMYCMHTHAPSLPSARSLRHSLASARTHTRTHTYTHTPGMFPCRHLGKEKSPPVSLSPPPPCPPLFRRLCVSAARTSHKKWSSSY